MKPGPNKKPNVIHLLNGNPSKLSQEQLKDGVHPEVVIPKCPVHLMPDAKKEWKRIAPILERYGLIAEMYRADLAVYCQAWAKWVQAETKIKELGESGLIEETPSGYKQMSVWQQLSNRAVEQMSKHGDKFGLSPSSVSRVVPSSQLDLVDMVSGSSEKSTSRFFD